MTNKLIHAFTPTGLNPPYINISRGNGGAVRVIVRGEPYPNLTQGTEEITLSAAEWRSLASSIIAELGLSDEQIKHMVSRFLAWKLPDTFNPDGGVSFEPTYKGIGGEDIKHEPVGTNLLTGTQADAMVRHMLEDLPAT